MSEYLTLPAGEIETITAKGSPRKFRIEAYSGGKMNHPAYDAPVVVDLFTLEMTSGKLPILTDHEGTTEAAVGHTESIEVTNKIVATGVLSGNNAATAELTAKLEDGFPMQASVGIRFKTRDRRFIEPGETIRANGQDFTGPLVFVQNAELFEISAVPLGADSRTSVALTAAAIIKRGTEYMFGKKETATDVASEDQIKAALGRLDEHASILDGTDYAELQAGIQSGKISEVDLGFRIAEITKQRADANELATIRASRPVPSVSHTRQAYVSDDAVIEAALLARAGHGNRVEKICGAEAANRAEGLRGSSMVEIIRAKATAEGHTLTGGPEEVLKFGFTTYSLPNILSNASGKVAREMFNDLPALWRVIAKEYSADDFKEKPHVRLLTGKSLEQVGKDGELKHGRLGESTFTTQAETYGQVYSITRQDYINDDLGLLQDIPRAAAIEASRTANDIVAKLLIDAPTGSGLFYDTAAGNYAGSRPLNQENLALGIRDYHNKMDAFGRSVGIAPETLVVPPSLEELALRLLNSDELQAVNNVASADFLSPNGNPFRNRLNVVVEPRLENTNISANASASTWFVFANREWDGMAVSFLNGASGPTVETMDADPFHLGSVVRVYFDFDAALGEPLASSKFTA